LFAAAAVEVVEHVVQRVLADGGAVVLAQGLAVERQLPAERNGVVKVCCQFGNQLGDLLHAVPDFGRTAGL